MKLSTSTNILFSRPNGSRASLEQTLRLASDAGFKIFDLNFYDWSLPGSVFLDDNNWHDWIYSVASTANELGVSFGQCHAYFYNFLNPNLTEEEFQRHHQLQIRSLECCKVLGAHTCVMHPETDYSGIDYYNRSVKANKEFYSKMLETMLKMNMRIALENMCDYGIAPKRKFCAYPEELVDFVSSFKDRNIGICWDFEHADIMQQDQVQAVKLMGKHLIATHVSDTYSNTEPTLMHVLPLTGNIEWTPIMQALEQIGYQDDFSFEMHNFINHIPDEMLTTALSLVYQIGEYLISLSH